MHSKPPWDRLTTRFAKEAMDRAVSIGLAENLRLEHRLFHLSFSTGELHDEREMYGPSRQWDGLMLGLGTQFSLSSWNPG
jgi:hypothetical protein